MARGLKGSNFGKWAKAAVNKGIGSIINGARNQLMSGVPKDFKRLAEKWSIIYVDLEKMLISCDDGPFKTPEEWDQEADLGIVKLQMLKMAMDMWKEMGRKWVKIKPQKPDMPQTIIEFDNGKVYTFSELFNEHKNDPIDDKARLLAKTVQQSDYSKEVILKK